MNNNNNNKLEYAAKKDEKKTISPKVFGLQWCFELADCIAMLNVKFIWYVNIADLAKSLCQRQCELCLRELHPIMFLSVFFFKSFSNEIRTKYNRFRFILISVCILRNFIIANNDFELDFKSELVIQSIGSTHFFKLFFQVNWNWVVCVCAVLEWNAKKECTNSPSSDVCFSLLTLAWNVSA